VSGVFLDATAAPAGVRVLGFSRELEAVTGGRGDRERISGDRWAGRGECEGEGEVRRSSLLRVYHRAIEGQIRLRNGGYNRQGAKWENEENAKTHRLSLLLESPGTLEGCQIIVRSSGASPDRVNSGSRILVNLTIALLSDFSSLSRM